MRLGVNKTRPFALSDTREMETDGALLEFTDKIKYANENK